MVVTKVLQIKSSQSLSRGVKYIEDEAKTLDENSLTGVARALRYIQNEQKTSLGFDEDNREFPWVMVDGKRQRQLVSTYGVTDASTATDEFELTRLNAKLTTRNSGKTSDVLAHHIIQSFSPEDDLSPEEIHEIGRRTVIELTGGQHEFVIATHVDKNHLHNHIIFNATNAVTLKKFRWQKGTKRSLENISDKHAELMGATIIDKTLSNSRKDYVAYRKKNVFKIEIKQRLDFVMKHSHSWDDFQEKAKALSLEVNLERKEVRYKLLDPLEGKYQERYTRDRILSKRGNYSLEAIQERLKDNQATLTSKEIVSAYQSYKEEQVEDFEMRIPVSAWQVASETEKGIYLELEYGLGNEGLVHIPSRYVDKLEDGNYELFLKKHDWFYFTNAKHAEMNRAMSGETIAKQLSYDNGQIVINKNAYISRMEQLVREFNFLNAHGITSGKQFEEVAQNFRLQFEETEAELEKLSQKIARLTKIESMFLGQETGLVSEDKLSTLLAEARMDKSVDKITLSRLIREARIEYEGLSAHVQTIRNEARQLETIRENTHKREMGRV
ncbi:relaxase/mobilization nuclease domain-containing protein [Streptococcus cameli]